MANFFDLSNLFKGKSEETEQKSTSSFANNLANAEAGLGGIGGLTPAAPLIVPKSEKVPESPVATASADFSEAKQIVKNTGAGIIDTVNQVNQLPGNIKAGLASTALKADEQYTKNLGDNVKSGVAAKQQQINAEAQQNASKPGIFESGAIANTTSNKGVYSANVEKAKIALDFMNKSGDKEYAGLSKSSWQDLYDSNLKLLGDGENYTKQKSELKKDIGSTAVKISNLADELSKMAEEPDSTDDYASVSAWYDKKQNLTNEYNSLIETYNNLQSQYSSLSGGSGSQKLVEWSDKVKADNQDLSETGQFFAELAYSLGPIIVDGAIGRVAAATGLAGGLAGINTEVASELGGSSSKLLNKLVGGLATDINGAAQDIGLASMGLNVYNNKMNQLISQGMGAFESSVVATKDALLEVATEKMWGGLPGMPKGEADLSSEYLSNAFDGAAKKITETVANNPALAPAIGKIMNATADVFVSGAGFLKTGVGDFLTDMLGEGIEEVTSEFWSPIFDKLLDSTIGTNVFESYASWADMGKAFAGGAITSAFLSGFSKIQNPVVQEKIANADTSGILSANNADEWENRVTGSTQTTDEVMNTFIKPEQPKAVVSDTSSPKYEAAQKAVESFENQELPVSEADNAIRNELKILTFGITAGFEGDIWDTVIDSPIFEQLGKASRGGLPEAYWPNSFLEYSPLLTQADVDSWIQTELMPCLEAYNKDIEKYALASHFDADNVPVPDEAAKT